MSPYPFHVYPPVYSMLSTIKPDISSDVRNWQIILCDLFLGRIS